MTSKQLILVSSSSMDNNTKREEDSLIRMSKKVRDSCKFSKDNIVIDKKDGTREQLNIFHAYKDDISWARSKYNESDFVRTAFVTSRTLKNLTGGNKDSNIWISEEDDKVVFGADPEFLIRKKDDLSIVNASSVLSPIGEMGSDGAMAEIRPLPSLTPEGLCINMDKIFRDEKYKSVMEQYLFTAGCYESNNIRDFPIGGHIHVGNPVSIKGVSISDRKLIYQVLNKILDELLAVPVSKLDLGVPGFKRRAECRMSPSGGYGYFGEYRLAKNKGDSDTEIRLEHRTLSGMWLIHPTVSKAVLGVAKMIIDSFWDLMIQNNFRTDFAFPNECKGKNLWSSGFKDWGKFQVCKEMGCVMSSLDIINILNSKESNVINKTFLNKWEKRIKSLSKFNMYQDYVKLLKNILTVSEKELSAFDRTIQNNWLESKKFIIE